MQVQQTEIVIDSLNYYLSLQYPVKVYPEKRGFTVIIHDLPGCMSQGANLDEAMLNISKARQIWIRTAYANDISSIPLPMKLIKQSEVN